MNWLCLRVCRFKTFVLSVDGVYRGEYPGAVKRALSPALECAYQVLATLLPTGGGCDIIDWVVAYARDFEGKLRIMLRGHTDQVLSLATLPRDRIASGSRDCTIRVWSTASGTCKLMLEGHTSSVLAIAVFPDDHLASGSYDRTVRIWDTKTGACTRTLLGHSQAVRALAALPNQLLASGSDDHTELLLEKGIESFDLRVIESGSACVEHKQSPDKC